MKNLEKTATSRLTSRENDATLSASDVRVRCTQRQLATVKAANSRIHHFAVSLYSLSLPGALRRGVTVYTSLTPAGSLFVPAVRGRGESGKPSIHRRSECCTTTTPPRNCAGSRSGSHPPSTKRAAVHVADAANSSSTRIPPDHLRMNQRPPLCGKQSTTPFFHSDCFTSNRENSPLMTHCA